LKIARNYTGTSILDLSTNSTKTETVRITYNESYVNVAHFCTHSRLRRDSGA